LVRAPGPDAAGALGEAGEEVEEEKRPRGACPGSSKFPLLAPGPGARRALGKAGEGAEEEKSPPGGASTQHKNSPLALLGRARQMRLMLASRESRRKSAPRGSCPGCSRFPRSRSWAGRDRCDRRGRRGGRGGKAPPGGRVQAAQGFLARAPGPDAT